MDKQIFFDVMVFALYKFDERDNDLLSLLGDLYGIEELEEQEWPFELQRIANKHGLKLNLPKRSEASA